MKTCAPTFRQRSLSVGRGTCAGLVGESGCGESMTALSVLRLVPTPPGEDGEGRIALAARRDPFRFEVGMRAIRGRLASMIFQEPVTSLNPGYPTIGNQVVEAVRLRGAGGRGGRISPSDLGGGAAVPRRRTRGSTVPAGSWYEQQVMIAMALCSSGPSESPMTPHNAGHDRSARAY